MSRSFRKNWVIKDYFRKKKENKRLANKTVRCTRHVQNGGWYKKVFCSYDICDWKMFWGYNPKMGRNPKKSVIFAESNEFFTPFWRYKNK